MRCFGRPSLALPLLAALVGGGCAHAPTKVAPIAAAPARPPAPVESGPQATGIWDWVYRSNDDQGNLRVEQEEWHLVQHGRAVEGYYDRAVTLLSTDDRLFGCNQKLGFTRFTRVRLLGSVAPEGRVRLDEIAYDATPGPCDDGARSLTSYDGELGQGTLRLRWPSPGDAGRQTLYRREGDGPHLAQLVGAAGPEPAGAASPSAAMGGRTPETGTQPAAASASVPVAGTWQWELRSIDAEGDDRHEREVWHLDETGDGISGFYDRTVTRRRDGDTFACNGAHELSTHTRYRVRGHRIGGVVVLSETDYEAERGPCDNGMRRLDTYQGTLAPAGDELILSWGPGNQILRRQREP